MCLFLSKIYFVEILLFLLLFCGRMILFLPTLIGRQSILFLKSLLTVVVIVFLLPKLRVFFKKGTPPPVAWQEGISEVRARGKTRQTSDHLSLRVIDGY